MVAVLVQGLTLGLSTGLFCLAYCAPVLVPFMLAEDRRLAANARVLGEVSLGRLLAYLAVGAGVGYLGMQIQGPVLDRVIGAALVVLALLLILYVVVQGWPHLSLCRRLNGRWMRFPILFGLLTGVNVCPPFLLAITSALGLASVLQSTLLFGGFFLGTTVYLLALLPLGALARWPDLRTIGRITAVLSGVFFLVVGVGRVVG